MRLRATTIERSSSAQALVLLAGVPVTALFRLKVRNRFMFANKWLVPICLAVIGLGLLIGLFLPGGSRTPDGPTTQSVTESEASESRNATAASVSNQPADGRNDLPAWNQAWGTAPRWTAIGPECGIDFRHENGMQGKFEYLEVMGGGIVAFDYDADDDLDLYFVNGNRFDGNPDPSITNRLYRNDNNWQFTDVTDEAGVGDAGYGQGAAAADYDGDGDLDLYVTNYGPNTLYRNNGDGTFTDVTQQAGVGDDGWGQSVCFFDYNGDGRLDLFVQNYLAYGSTRGVEAYIHVGSKRVPDYPSPLGFPGAPDRLFENQGDGTFMDVSERAGLNGTPGKGMGLACVDFNGDRLPDIFIANDTMENFLYINQDQGTFREIGQQAGVAYNLSGTPEASMGVDVADYDHDGDLDLIVPCLERQFFTLYRNDPLQFTDVSTVSGMAQGTAEATGFDAHFVDYDNDGDLDLFFTCGAVRRVETAPADADYDQGYGMQDLLLVNDGAGHFVKVNRWAGAAFQSALIGRGSILADLDDDGDQDIVVSNLAQRPTILRNDTPGGNWLTLELVDRAGRTNPNGCDIWLTTPAGRRLHHVIHPGTTYLSQSDRRPRFGLGTEQRAASIEITWPSGTKQQLTDELDVNQTLVIGEE